MNILVYKVQGAQKDEDYRVTLGVEEPETLLNCGHYTVVENVLDVIQTVIDLAFEDCGTHNLVLDIAEQVRSAMNCGVFRVIGPKATVTAKVAPLVRDLF